MGSIKQNLANNILSGGKFDATDLDGTIPNTNINDNSIDNVTSFPAAGSGIPSVASDPPSPSAGDVWYNTTSNVFKYLGVTTAGSWATGPNMNDGTGGPGFSGDGTDSNLAFGGGLGTPFPDYTGKTESFNGTAWSEVADLNTARNNLGGAGADNTSALAIAGSAPGGSPPLPIVTESWNGSSWTEVNDLSSARSAVMSAGVLTTALSAGGSDMPDKSIVEEWNGTSWTEVNDLNTGRYGGGASGVSSTSVLVFGGYDTPPAPGPTGYQGATESWNGTSWTEVGDLNTKRYGNKGTGASNTSAITFGGQIPPGGYSGVTEIWNGTSWTEDTDLSTARLGPGAGGTATAAIAFGGNSASDTPTTATELWVAAGSPVTKTVTTA